MANAEVTWPEVDYVFLPAKQRPLDGFARFDRFRQLSPFVRSREAQGYVIATRHEHILDGLQRTDLFSSCAMVPTEPVPGYRLIPEMLDPPEHTKWRRLLGPFFAPGRVSGREPAIRRRCTDLIDSVKDAGGCDFMTDFARQYPTTIFLEIMGLPADELDRFMAWEDLILHGSVETDPDRSLMMTASVEVMAYFQQFIGECRERPGERHGLVAEAVEFRLDDQPIPDADLLSLCLLMFMAGLDTVASQLSYMFLHLATHPADRETILATPDRMDRAVEEFLRLHPIVQTSRKVTRDVDFHGCPLRAGDMIMFPFASASRDEALYPDPAAFRLDRETTRHISFGAGPHRCLGSHLARLELRIALEEWHRRIPTYAISDGCVIGEHGGGVHGLDTLPLSWPRG